MIKALVSWKGGMAFTGVSGSGHEVQMDAAPEAGGGDTAARPMEVVLAALGGCTGMDVVSILNKMRLEYERFEMEIAAERSAEHPKVFTEITIIYRIWGAKVPRDLVEKAVRLSQEKYCSVSNMLNKVAHLRYRVDINGEEGTYLTPSRAE